ncbi:MAG TPA: PepSY domain-containing protein [Candidatus Anaerotruncus excrementipullorum]|uniref:PepSY domain-containing protein n=1 Tax=Candidatus Anaerotruncus excrementipullorum TaxID=2838465 RepID=A0A9D1WPD6_9FIRM|nr:PepSY domain-containing protein [Candidatus Anaerotruncus excrementipullorum]
MKRIFSFGLAAGVLLACLIGCSVQQGTVPSGQAAPASAAQESPSGQRQAPSPSSAPNEGSSSGEISREEALAIALDNAGVPEGDAYNIKNETDGDHGIPIYDIEFETEYGDYDFEIAMDGGRIVGADYEVDEEWLNTLGGSPVSMEEATEIVAGKVPGSSAADVTIWEESGDGRGRYEGELFFDGMKFEFEIDPQTGIIFDWNTDLRD